MPPLTRSNFAPARRLRAAGPQGPGGVSSLLRLSNPAAPRLPKGAELSNWVTRAAQRLLGGGGERMPDFASSTLFR